jgi:hypothetical protein
MISLFQTKKRKFPRQKGTKSKKATRWVSKRILTSEALAPMLSLLSPDAAELSSKMMMRKLK